MALRIHRLRAGALLAALTLLLIAAGCAQTPPRGDSTYTHDWPMVPSQPTTSAHRADSKAIGRSNPGSYAMDADNSAESLVSLPVPPDYTRMAELGNLFDRIRLGYSLPDVENPLIDQQVRYFSAMPDYLDRTFGRADRYLYYVVRELEARNMPLELSMLPIVESSYNPYAYSRARAAGLWQFIAPTASRYQVRVNWWQDGRRDVVDSTRAALDYLSELHMMFDGDWLKAIAAYNCGELAVQRAIDKNKALGLPTDFWHLSLPAETKAYVPKLLALARIVDKPDRFGLEFTSIDNKPYFAQVEVGTPIDLRVAASILGISEPELHALNPAFNRWATDPDGPHHLLVPYASAAEFAQAVTELTPEMRMPMLHYTARAGDHLESIARTHHITVPTIRALNSVIASDVRPGDDLILPTTTIAPLRAGLIIEGELPAHSAHKHSYVVRHGDTLASIAKHQGMTLKDLERLNGLSSKAHLTAGHHLTVERPTTPSGATLPRTAKNTSARPATVTTAATTAAAPRVVHYAVHHGDTLHSVAKRFKVSITELKTWNKLHRSSLQAGQTLLLYTGPERDVGG
jgi:membrane-bound lytic murein transglycosylase D